jgi:predicted amidohydrolase YtcJ
MSCLLVLPLLRSEEPKIILYNGKIWTADESQPLAQAIAISGGRFLAVGSNDDVVVRQIVAPALKGFLST